MSTVRRVRLVFAVQVIFLLFQAIVPIMVRSLSFQVIEVQGQYFLAIVIYDVSSVRITRYLSLKNL